MCTSKTTLLCTLALAAFFTACTIDDSPLDTRLFACTNDGSCGDGWGCKRATPYALDFCAERCTPGDVASCDGICTRDNLCLRGCQIYDDGTTSACPSRDYACIRSSIERDSGVCYPVTVCALDADCPIGQACLSEGFGTDQLYCVPSAAAAACAPGSVSAAGVFNTDAPYCFPTCEDADICPPGFGCLTQASLLGTPEMPVADLCIPGIYGVACDDDSNCLQGRCLDTGAVGRICTMSCNEASRQFGALGCGGLSRGASFDGFFEMECDAGAGGGADGGLCSVRYAVGWPSCTPPGGAYPCVSDPPGIECLPLDLAGVRYDICSRACTSHAECNAARDGDRNFCAGLAASGSGICYPRGGAGDSCFDGMSCRSGICAGAIGSDPGTCMAPR